MSAPVILSVAPAPDETDVVLGRVIEVTFDQAVDPDTVTSATFALTGPGETTIVDGDELAYKNAKPSSGREYITGAFNFPSPDKLRFTPDKPLRPGIQYTVLIAGASSLLATSVVRNPAGEALAKSYQYAFKTGTLNVATPPALSPLPPAAPWERPRLDPNSIRIRSGGIPVKAVANELSYIELIFPAAVDPTSFDQNDLRVAIEPFLGDTSVPLPDNVTVSAAVQANRIVLTVISGPGASTVRSPKIGFASAPPTSGAYIEGDILYQTHPQAGGNVGWVCTASGQPGVWKSFGSIAS